MILPGDGWFYVLFYPKSTSPRSAFTDFDDDGRFEELADKLPIFQTEYPLTSIYFMTNDCKR